MELLHSTLVILCAFFAGTALGVIIGGLCAAAKYADATDPLAAHAHRFRRD